jgi:hypothetical protein
MVTVNVQPVAFQAAWCEPELLLNRIYFKYIPARPHSAQNLL